MEQNNSDETSLTDDVSNEKEKHLASMIGNQAAKSFFTDMLNVDMHGHNFKWDNFPKMFEGILKTSVFMYFSETPPNLSELKEIAYAEFEKEGLRLKSDYEKINKLPVKI